ncbi:MAG: helix-turn-helix transcriptional regulator [Akkermansiaceae bacterium]
MRQVLKNLCATLGASDASWMVMSKLESDHPMLPKAGYFDEVIQEMKGWTPLAAVYLNPQKVLKRVYERWCMHARKSGIDPMTRELVKNVGESRACIREDVFTDKEWGDHWMVRNFLNYYGVGERMVGVIPIIHNAECVVVLDRPVNAKPFTQSDKHFFHLAIAGLRELQRNLSLERGAIQATAPLSRRERETYCYLLTSMSEGEIAVQMKLSSHTVHDYARKLYKKFDVKGRVGLMALVLGSE